jgi:hypothetical protein
MRLNSALDMTDGTQARAERQTLSVLDAVGIIVGIVITVVFVL